MGVHTSNQYRYTSLQIVLALNRNQNNTIQSNNRQHKECSLRNQETFISERSNLLINLGRFRRFCQFRAEFESPCDKALNSKSIRSTNFSKGRPKVAHMHHQSQGWYLAKWWLPLAQNDAKSVKKTPVKLSDTQESAAINIGTSVINLMSEW